MLGLLTLWRDSHNRDVIRCQLLKRCDQIKRLLIMVITHCRPMTSYGDKDRGQRWLKQWLVAWRAPSHHLNQSRLIIDGRLWRSSYPFSHKVLKKSICQGIMKNTLLELILDVSWVSNLNRLWNCYNNLVKLFCAQMEEWCFKGNRQKECPLFITWKFTIPKPSGSPSF